MTREEGTVNTVVFAKKKNRSSDALLNSEASLATYLYQSPITNTDTGVAMSPSA